MRPLALPTVLCAVLSFAALGIAGSDPEDATARVFDRTYACTTEIHGGLRLLTVDAQSSARGQEDAYGQPLLANAFLHTGGPVISGTLGPVISGGETLVRMAAGGRRPATLQISQRRCKATRMQVPLSTRGLDGGAATSFHDTFQCYPAKSIVVRIRAVFRTNVVLIRSQGVLTTGAPIREAAFGARTESGKPLLYAGIAESGKARLFTAPSCFRD